MADERFLYFAYGSNMLTRRLRQRTPSARPVSTGFVDGYRLSFRKASRGRVRNSGKCDIEPTGANGDRVYGVLFSIVNSEAQALRDAEGPGYDEKTMNVGTAQGKETAIVYIANDIVSGLRPYDWYKAFVVAERRNTACPQSMSSGSTNSSRSRTRTRRDAPEKRQSSAASEPFSPTPWHVRDRMMPDGQMRMTATPPRFPGVSPSRRSQEEYRSP